jgi:hypothetical protein
MTMARFMSQWFGGRRDRQDARRGGVTRRTRAIRPGVSPLEGRQMLSVTATAYLSSTPPASS